MRLPSAPPSIIASERRNPIDSFRAWYRYATMAALATMEKREKKSFPPISIPNAIPGFSMYVRRRKFPRRGRLDPYGTPLSEMPSAGNDAPLMNSLAAWSEMTMMNERISTLTRYFPAFFFARAIRPLSHGSPVFLYSAQVCAVGTASSRSLGTRRPHVLQTP